MYVQSTRKYGENKTKTKKSKPFHHYMETNAQMHTKNAHIHMFKKMQREANEKKNV